MRAYITSIGEKTTDICKEQLERFGYEVIVLAGKESWYDKYKRFIFQADEDCIRIDADVIPNESIKHLDDFAQLMVQAYTYDFYRNNVGVSSPVLYRKDSIEIIKNNWHLIGKSRPETDASRIPEINQWFYTTNWVVGTHGFFQTKEDLRRHLKNKTDRKQLEYYDFILAEKLINLK